MSGATLQAAWSATGGQAGSTERRGEEPDNPDQHDRACTLQCARSGYGILVEGGKFLKFDAAGNKQWRAVLEKTDRKDHLRATVTGTLDGDTIKVTALSLQ